MAQTGPRSGPGAILGGFRSREQRDCPEGYVWDNFKQDCVRRSSPMPQMVTPTGRALAPAYTRDSGVKSGLTPVGHVNIMGGGAVDPGAYARPQGGGVGGGVGGGGGSSYAERQHAMEMEESRLELERELGMGTLKENRESRISRDNMEKARLTLEREVSRGNLSIAQANQKLQEFVAKGNLDIQKSSLDIQKELGLGKLDIEKGYLEETTASRTSQERWRQQLLDEMLGMMGEGGGGTDAINWDALEERMYMPAQRDITTQMKQGLATMGGQAAGAGYGGRSSWEDRQRAGILTGGARAIGDVRSEAGVQTTRAKLEERSRQRQQRLAMTGMLASLGG